MSARDVRRAVGSAALGCALAALLTACTEDAPKDDPTPASQFAGTNPACQPLSMIACPCAGGGMGSQSCLATGAGYGACTGCPAPSTTPASDDTPLAGGAAPLSPDASTDMQVPVSSDAGVAPGDAAPASAPDAATFTDLGLAPVGTAIGVSCGVGLPVLCALEGQKCCARSLRTDTCIGATDTCDCDLGDCTVMEAFCDGPEDCADGEVCCGTLVGGSRYDRFACAASCDYAGTQRIACHQDAPACPGNNECANSQLLTNVQVCIDPATIRQ